MRTRWLAIAAISGLLPAAPGGAGGGPDRPTRSPRWQHPVPAGVEWCAVGPTRAGLLLFDKAGRLDLLDPHSGQSRLSAPVALEKGTRPADTAGPVTYLFGPTTVCALRAEERGSRRLSAAEVIAWRVVGATPPVSDDPETTNRIVAARPTSAGVLVARSDGRIAELDAAAGAPRWSATLAPLDVCTLEVRAGRAALVTHHAGTLRVAFFDLTADHPRPVETILPGPAPLWSGLSDRGVVAVWARRWMVLSPGRPPRVFRFPAAVRATAAGVGLGSALRGATARGRAEARADALLLIAGQEGLCAFDIATGRMIGSPARDPGAGRTCRRLLVRTAVAVTTSDRHWTLWKLPELSMLARGEGVVLDAATPASAAPPAATAPVASVRVPRAWLGIAGRGPHPALHLTRVAPRPAADSLHSWTLAGASGNPRRLVWLPQTLVVVESRQLLAYTLP